MTPGDATGSQGAMISQKKFRRIRDAFFPRWRRGRDWRLSLHADLDGADGRCDTESKRIRLVRCDRSSDELVVVLVHEICHAVAANGHGAKWQRRMLKAGEDAERLGMPVLAGMIRIEVEAYRIAPKTTVGEVYGRIVEAAQDYPQVRFISVINLVRKDYGRPLAEFLDCYPRSRRVFDAARQDLARREAAMARLESRLAAAAEE
jgi:hypothetical protein